MRPRQRHTTSTTAILPQVNGYTTHSSIAPFKRRREVPYALPLCVLLVLIAVFSCFQLWHTSRLAADEPIPNVLLADVLHTLQSSECSNTTSLQPDDESAPDVPAACRKRWYRTRPDELPSAELVIAANKDDCPGSILRTVALALLHAKPSLLAKAWVITSFPLSDELADALLTLPRTTILYRPELDTTAALRNEGAESVRSPVVVFLTPGVLPAQSWLEPLLGEIAEDKIKSRRATLALPATAPKRRGASPPTVGHDWGLRRLLFSRVHMSGFANEASAAHSPFMPHGDFAVSTKYWEAIGGYEDGGDTELAFRVWQCGGSIATIPCSRVHRPNGEDFELRGHVRRLDRGLKHDDRLRVARRWMGPYAMLAEFANGVLPNSTRLAPGEEGQCPPGVASLFEDGSPVARGGYHEYMGVAFPEMQSSAQIMLGSKPKLGLRGWGKLRLVGHDICVSLENRAFGTARCKEATVLLMSRGGYMFAAPRLTSTCVTRKDERLVSMRCDVFMEGHQTWEIETRRETSVFARVDGEPKCLTADADGKLSFAPCLPERETRQTWVWQHRAPDDAVGDDNRADLQNNSNESA